MSEEPRPTDTSGHSSTPNTSHDSQGNFTRGRGRGMYQSRGGHGGRAQSTPYQPPTPEQQRFLNSRNTLRNALEEVDIETGRSMMVRQPRVEGQATPSNRGGPGSAYNSQQQNGIPAAHITPHAASQSQLAQHGATVVRSSVVSVPQGAVHFFSSIQKRGGAFTTSERETYDQLRRSGAISKDRGMRNVASKYAGAVKSVDLERRFARLQADRAADDFASASRKRHRFELSDSDSPSDTESDDADVSAPSSAEGPAHTETDTTTPTPDADS